MVQWTPDQVVALATDASSVKAGQKLSKLSGWLTTGTNGTVLWGEFKGSGKSPYRTQIVLGEPAFKCTCPSRKFPCKHALGLLLGYSENPSAVGQSDPPDWVQEWLDKR